MFIKILHILKKILLSVMIIGSYVTAIAQQEEKVKGNKEVVEKRLPLSEAYHTLDVDGDFEVYLRKQSTLSATIETDSNLLPYIDVSVANGVLTITTTKTISRAKELKVEVGYTSELATILAKDDVEIKVDQSLKGDKLLVEAKGNASLEFDSSASFTDISLKNKAKYKGQMTSKSVTVDQSGSSKTGITITGAEKINITLHEKSVSELTGESQVSAYLLDGDTFLNAIKLSSALTNISSADDADTYAKCGDKAILQLSGKSDTYIMGNPLIQLTSFEDESSLHKTKKEPSSLGRLLR